MNGAPLPGHSIISQQFGKLPSHSLFPFSCHRMTPYCWSTSSILLPINQHVPPQAVVLPPSTPFSELPAIRIVPVQRNALLCFFLQRPLFLIAELQRFQLRGMSHNMQKMWCSSWRGWSCSLPGHVAFLLLWCWSILGLIRHFSRLSGIGKSCGCLICHVQFRTACVFPLFQSTLRELTSVWHKVLFGTASSFTS